MGAKIVFFILILVTAGAARAGDISDSLDDLNSPSPRRDQMVAAENARLRSAMAKNANFLKLQKMDVRRVLTTQLAETSDGHVIYAFQKKPGAPELICSLDPKTGLSQVLFWTMDLGLGLAAHIVDGGISPDGRWLWGKVELHGQYDHNYVLLYDLQRNMWVKKYLQKYSYINGWTDNRVGVSFADHSPSDYVELGDQSADSGARLPPSAPMKIDVSSLVPKPVYMGPDQPVEQTAFATSRDGMKILYKIYRLPGTRKTGNNPVIIDSYGGFGVSNIHYMADDNIWSLVFPERMSMFFKRGGILVMPALRGGVEGGDAWHAMATGIDKKNTFYDLIGVANDLVLQGWTKPHNIVSMGGSNGGLTVAAAALLSPGTFGLVIPQSGVLDLDKIIDLDEAGGYWASEYGNPLQHGWAMAAISPVDLASHQGSQTKFFIVAGDADDRVNVTHSIKFFTALKQHGGHPENVQMSITHNEGHTSCFVPFYGDPGPTFTSDAMWAAIFDQFDGQ